MSKLHVTTDVADDAPGARVGGKPLAPAGTNWPMCAKCKGPLRFIAQHSLANGKLLSLFQCENDPGSCAEWEPASGGNLAMVWASGPAMAPPESAEALRARFPSGVASTFEPPKGLKTSEEEDGAVGQFGGEPEWIQHDETPNCCDKPMGFVLQLEENAHRQLNFCGGGAAYAFVCSACEEGAYLMQQ